MKKFIILGTLLLSATLARAGLIGDTVTYSHFYPDSSSAFWQSGATITAGNSDLLDAAGMYTIDGEDSSIALDFTTIGSWTVSAFNGFAVTGIDDLINSVTVSTNMAGWDNSRLTFGAGEIWANFAGLSIDTNSYLTLNVNSTSSVPDSGSMLALVGFALVGFAGLRRKIARV